MSNILILIFLACFKIALKKIKPGNLFCISGNNVAIMSSSTFSI